jgi:hypothetical protein
MRIRQTSLRFQLTRNGKRWGSKTWLLALPPFLLRLPLWRKGLLILLVRKASSRLSEYLIQWQRNFEREIPELVHVRPSQGVKPSLKSAWLHSCQHTVLTALPVTTHLIRACQSSGDTTELGLVCRLVVILSTRVVTSTNEPFRYGDTPFERRNDGRADYGLLLLPRRMW